MAFKKIKPPISWWRALGTDAKAMYRNIIFDGGKNVYGGKWFGGSSGYNSEYWRRKSSNSFSRQDETLGVKATAVLTMDLLKSFDAFLNVKKDGFEFGYKTNGDIVKSLRDRKKEAGTLTSKDKPVPDKVSKFIASEYHKFMRKNQKNQTRTHGKGKPKTK